MVGWPPSFKEPRTRSLVEKWKEGRRIGTVLSFFLSLSFIFFSPTPLTSFAQGEAAANVRFQLHCGGGEFSFLRQKLKYQGQGKDKLSHMTFLMIHQSRAAGAWTQYHWGLDDRDPLSKRNGLARSGARK